MNVLTMAPAKVRQGAVRLQGSASLPTPDTKVRVAWALAGPADKVSTTTVARIEMDNALLRMRGSLVVSDCLAVRGSFTRESPIELRQDEIGSRQGDVPRELEVDVGDAVVVWRPQSPPEMSGVP